MNRTIIIALVSILWIVPSVGFAKEMLTSGQQTSDIINASGIQGGLVVHLGCGDGKLTAALRADERYLVHGLERDAERYECVATGCVGHIAYRHLCSGLDLASDGGRHDPTFRRGQLE